MRGSLQDRSSSSAVRADIAQAFAHLASRQPTGETVEAQVRAMRRFVDGYGDVHPRGDLKGVEVRRCRAAKAPAEWIIPERVDGSSRIVHLHGGGWVAGGLESHRPMAAALALEARAPVLLVDYRLAPEHPFPAGLQDSIAAFAWACENGPEGSGAPKVVSLVGDSAGANLATAVCAARCTAGERGPDRLALIAAPLEARSNGLRTVRGQAAGEDEAALDGVIALYAQGAALDDPGLSPLRLADDVLARFPPTLLQVSAAEFLLWDSERFASRLAAQGVRTCLSVWPEMPHVWHAFLTLLPESRQALREVARFLAESVPE